MKSVIDSLFTAFSLYSAIPVPKTDWEGKHMRYVLCFFPLIGVVVGVVVLLWHELARYTGMATGFFAAVATLLPVLVSGGIHMDAWIDTGDAIHSHQPAERRLEILKDPHSGAFGILHCAGYLLLAFGCWMQIGTTPRLLPLVVLGYPVSRAMCAFVILQIQPARKEGLVYFIRNQSAASLAKSINIIVVIFFLLWGIWMHPLWGGVIAGLVLLSYLWFRRLCLDGFGGNTGDLAGFYLMLLELFYLLIAALGGLLG